MVDALNTILQKCNTEVIAVSLAPKLLAEINNPKDVFAQAKEFYDKDTATCTGWLCFTDKVQIIPDEFSFADSADHIILSGELARETVSLHIRQSDAGWQLYELTRCEDNEMLMIEESFLSIRKKGRKLCYENYWHKVRNPEGHEVFQPFAARFTGFSSGGK